MCQSQALPSAWTDREKLREKGQFWTPRWIAKAMAAYVSDGAELVFDPATGRGAFFEALLDLNKSNVRFWGTDVDSSVLSDPIYRHPNAIVENRDFIRNPPQRKFGAIIANPPYIRHHRIDQETKGLLKHLSTKTVGRPLDGRAGYHIYFLIQALDHLENNGKLAFIMPADTCEGKFARELWDWISENFCIECVITFEESAAPFPNVDTNAIIFLIRNAAPSETLYWTKTKQSDPDDLCEYVTSGFKERHFTTLEVSRRDLKEAIATGLSRPPQKQNRSAICLSDFANVMRGIVTGSNSFFFLTSRQIEELKIPMEFFKRAIGRTKDATKDILTERDVQKLDEKSRPTFLLSIDGSYGYDSLPESINNYLQAGHETGLPDHPVLKQRSPWYKMETRQAPPILFAYLGRRNARFILNQANVIPLTAFLCVYPNSSCPDYVNSLWLALNHPDTLANLQLVGKSYGSGAIKVEPSGLRNLPIPEHIAASHGLLSAARPGLLCVDHPPLLFDAGHGGLSDDTGHARATALARTPAWSGRPTTKGPARGWWTP